MFFLKTNHATLFFIVIIAVMQLKRPEDLMKFNTKKSAMPTD